MAIVATDILLKLSGGAANANPDLALGGAMSSTQPADGVDNAIIDDVTSAQAVSGSVEYRGLYWQNNHATLTLGAAVAFISSPTSSADDEIDIGVAVEAVSVTMATIANESTAPTSVTFSRPSTFATGLQLNSTTGLAPAAFRGFWLRRTVNAGAAAATAVVGTLKCEGTTT